MRLEGKAAIVTGGGRGVGRAICLALAREGADVLLCDLDLENAQAVAREVEQAGRRALAVQADVAQNQAVKEMVRKGMEHFGKIDILVNNVGWSWLMPFVENTEEFWNKVIAINLMGVIYCIRAVLDQMIERQSGKIVNIGSDAARVGSSNEAVYSAAKGGVVALTKALARELARYNININCICPGPTDTPLLGLIRETEIGQRQIEATIRGTPLRRMGKPEEIADAVVFLASDEASFITGQTLSVSGGLTMC